MRKFLLAGAATLGIAAGAATGASPSAPDSSCKQVTPSDQVRRDTVALGRVDPDVESVP